MTFALLDLFSRRRIYDLKINMHIGIFTAVFVFNGTNSSCTKILYHKSILISTFIFLFFLKNNKIKKFLLHF